MCTKKRFTTRALALQRLSEIKDKGEVKEWGIPLREYYCGECGGYHLTKQKMSSEKRKNITERKKNFSERMANHWINKMKW